MWIEQTLPAAGAPGGAVYLEQRGESGRPMSLTAPHSSRGRLNGLTVEVICWINSDILGDADKGDLGSSLGHHAPDDRPINRFRLEILV